MRRAPRILVAVIILAFGLVPASHAAGSLTATYVLASAWANGYEAGFRITNSGTATVNGWRLEFDLPAGQVITSSWEGIDAPLGQHHVVVNQLWNGTLVPGASVTFGYVASFMGAYAPPTNCTINATPCDGGSPTPSPTPSQSVTPSPSPSPSASPSPSPSPSIGPTATPTLSPAPPTASSWAFAPYADMTLWPPIDLVATMRESGVRYFSLAFVVTGSTPCKGAWGGITPVGEDDINARVAALRDADGDVVLSFGGANGHELALTCPTPDLLAAEYQRIIDRYQATRVDFDIEGSATADTVSVTRRSQAIAKLQRDAADRGRTLVVSLTLPVLPSGLTHDGLNVVRNASANGARVDVVNIMAMDYGPANAPNASGQMGEYAIQAAQNTHRQLSSIYSDRTADEVWAMVGVTPMIGQNDVQGEIFDLDDAKQVSDFASQTRVGRLAMWSVARDKQCAEGIKPWADPTCSGILQEKWGFSRRFNTYRGRG